MRHLYAAVPVRNNLFPLLPQEYSTFPPLYEAFPFPDLFYEAGLPAPDDNKALSPALFPCLTGI